MTNPPWGSEPERSDEEPTAPYRPYGQGDSGSAAPPPYSRYDGPTHAETQPAGPPYGQVPGQPYGQSYGQVPVQPYGGFGYQAPPATNGMAIASLIVSLGGILLCCGAPGVVGAILGHVARRQIRERGEQGDGIALAGVIVGWLAFAAFLAIAAFYIAVIAVAATSTPEPTYSSY